MGNSLNIFFLLILALIACGCRNVEKNKKKETTALINENSKVKATTQERIERLQLYSFPVESFSFTNYLVENKLGNGHFYFDLNLNDTTQYLLYNSKDINDVSIISGNELDRTKLYGKNIAIGYSQCQDCYLVYYIGLPNRQLSAEPQIMVGVDFYTYSGGKIDIHWESEIVQFCLMEAYNSDATWVNTTFKITNFNTIFAKTFYHEEEGIFMVENMWSIDFEENNATKKRIQ